MKEWIVPCIGVFICWGLWGFLPKITIKYIDPKSAVIWEVLGGVIVAAVVLFLLKFKIAVNPTGISVAVITGLLGFFGSLLFLYAVNKGPLSIVVTLSALYPILSIALAMIFLNESITIKQGIGIVFALAAMVLISS